MSDLTELFTELRQRKIIQVLIAYAVVAWGAAQVAEFAVENYDLSRKLLDATLLLLGLGLPAAMVITWYHGERGHQRATKMEAVILTTLLLLAGIGTYRISRAEPSFDLSVDEVLIDMGSESVAVLPFENRLRDPDLDWLGSGLAELVTTGLAQVPALQVVSGQRLFDLLRREGREDTERIPDELATRIATRAGARYMVDGSILGSSNDITVNANLVDVKTGRVVAASKARGPDVFALVDSISGDLSEQILGASAVPTEVASVSAVTTENLDAYRAFQSGLQAQRRFKLDEAYEHYQRAVELDPNFAIANLRLSGLALENGDISTALKSLRAASENRDRASGRDRLYLDGLLANILDRDPDAARESLTELVERFPEDKEGRMALWRFYDSDSEERRRLMEDGIRFDPMFASAYNELAYWHARNGNFEVADSLIGIYAELEPGQPNPSDSRGEILEMAGEYERSREAYREALRIDPGFTVSLNHLARSWILLEGQPLGAVREMEPFTRDSIPAVRIRALSLTADALLAAGRLDAGVEIAQRAAEEAAASQTVLDDSQLRFRLLPIYLALRDLDALNATIAQMQLIDRDNPIVPFYALIALGEQGQLEAMEAYGDQIRARVDRVPEMAQFAPAVKASVDAQLAYYRGDYELAAAKEDTVRRFGGSPLIGSFSEPRSLLALGRGQRALEVAQQLERQGLRGGRVDAVTYRQAVYYQARAHELLGDTAQAIDRYEAVLEDWEEAVRSIPALRDTPERLTALRAGHASAPSAP